MSVLTLDDIQNIRELMEIVVDEKISKLAIPSAEIIRSIVREELAQQTSYLPTKDEFYSRMDAITGELDTTRKEQVVLTYQIETIDQRVSALESLPAKKRSTHTV